MLDKFKGYRTAIVNTIFTIAGIAVSFGWVPENVQALIVEHTDAVLGAIMTIWGVVNVALRKATTTPLGESS